MCGKSPATTTTNNVTSNTPPPQVLAQYQNVVNSANQVAQTPYSAYGGQYVAPINSQENAGIGGINQYANFAQPDLATAASGTLGAIGGTASALNPIGAAQIANYQSPYTQSVVNATQAEFNNQDIQQAQSLNSNAIGAGAFGGDRAGIAQGNLVNQQQVAQAPTIAALYNQGYSQALGEANTEQQAALSGYGQIGALGSDLGNIGVAAQTAGLQGANEQVQAGSLQQQTQQAEDTALYNQFLQQQAYPFQTTGWQANISEGIGSQEGGTSTSTGQTTAPGPSALGTGIGAATAGLGILSSLPSAKRGGRVEADDRENIQPIGKSFDGKTIYKFNFRGDPRTHVGFINHKMMVNPREHRQIGGNIGGGVGGGVFTSPTTPFQPTGAPYANVMGYVPPSQAMSIGHTMPTSAGQPAPAAQSQGQPTAAQMGAFGTAIGKGGLQAYNALNGDAIFNNAITDAAASGQALGTPDFSNLDDTDFELARGGHVRDRFQTGGTSAYSAINPLYSQLEAPVIDSKTGEKVYNGLTNNYTSPFAFGGGVRGAFDDGGSILDSAFGPSASAYAPTPAPPIQTAANASGLANLVGKLESNNGATAAAQPASMADKIYGQYPAFVQQYGDGPAGIANYAQKTLAAKPDATLGDFYAGYVLNTANPGGHSFAELENTNLPGAQGAAYNLLKNSGYSPDTPLAAVMGGASGAGGSGGYTSPYSAAMAGAPPPQSPYSTNLQNQGQEKGLLGLPKDLAGPLMAAGFGMMASRSPWAGVAIGEGGQAGLQYYQKNQELNRQYALTQAQIDNMSSEARDRDADVGLRSRQLDLQMQLMQRQIAGAAAAAGVSGSNPPVAPGLASAPGTPVAGVPAVAPARSASPLGPPMPTPIQKAAAIPTTGVPSAGPIAPTTAGAPNPAQVAALNSQMKAPAANVPAAGAQPAVATAPAAPTPAQPTSSAQSQLSVFKPDGSLKDQNDPAWSQVPAEINYYGLMQRARAAQAYGNNDAANALMTRAQALVAPGASILPGSTAAAAARAAQIAGQEAQARASGEVAGGVHKVFDANGAAIPVNGQTYQKIADAGLTGGVAQPGGQVLYAEAPPQAKATAQTYEEFQKNALEFNRDYAPNRQMLTSLATIYQNWQSGRGGEAMAELSGWAKRFGVDQALPSGVQNAAAAFDAATKIAVAQSFRVLQESGAQRAPRTGLQEALLTSPRPGADPTADWKVLSDTLARLDYDHDLYGSVIKTGAYAVNPAIDQFVSSHPYDAYVDSAHKQTPIFKGITPESYHSITGAKLQKDQNTGRVRADGHYWDPNGNPEN